MWCEVYLLNGLAGGGETGSGATVDGGDEWLDYLASRCAHPTVGPHGTPPDGLRLRAERLRVAAGRAQVARTPPAPRQHRPRSASHPFPSGRAAPVLTGGRFSRAALAPQVPRDDQAGRHMRRPARRQAGGRRARARVRVFCSLTNLFFLNIMTTPIMTYRS